MGYIKAVILVFGLVGFALFGFFMSLLALPVTFIEPSIRYRLALFFLVPFGLFARALVGIDLIVINAEGMNAHPSAVFIGNHQSGFDLAVVGKLCKAGTLMVGKRELLRVPVFGWLLWLTGNLLIDRKNLDRAKKQLADAKEKITKYHLNLAVMPEGTRGTEENLLPFKKGPFHTAIDLKLPIIPVVTSSLKGKGIWEKAELSGGTVYVSVLPPVSIVGVTPENLAPFIEKVRNDMNAEFKRLNALPR